MDIYNTSIENSFLKALGPHKIQTTGESFSGVVAPESIDPNEPIVVGEIKRYGEKQVIGTKQNQDLASYLVPLPMPLLMPQMETQFDVLRSPTLEEAELVVDNLFNREEEPEDAILVASGGLQQLVDRALQEPPSPDWERELDEL